MNPIHCINCVELVQILYSGEGLQRAVDRLGARLNSSHTSETQEPLDKAVELLEVLEAFKAQFSYTKELRKILETIIPLQPETRFIISNRIQMWEPGGDAAGSATKSDRDDLNRAAISAPSSEHGRGDEGASITHETNEVINPDPSKRKFQAFIEEADSDANRNNSRKRDFKSVCSVGIQSDSKYSGEGGAPTGEKVDESGAEDGEERHLAAGERASDFHGLVLEDDCIGIVPIIISGPSEVTIREPNAPGEKQRSINVMLGTNRVLLVSGSCSIILGERTEVKCAVFGIWREPK